MNKKNRMRLTLGSLYLVTLLMSSGCVESRGAAELSYNDIKANIDAFERNAALMSYEERKAQSDAISAQITRFSECDQIKQKKGSILRGLIRLGRVIHAMTQTFSSYRDVVLIYNDPSITRFGSYQPLDYTLSHTPKTRMWFPMLSKKTEGSPVTMTTETTKLLPIYYKMYLPNTADLTAVVFDVYGGGNKREDYVWCWPSVYRTLSAKGIGVVQVSLSDSMQNPEQYGLHCQ